MDTDGQQNSCLNLLYIFCTSVLALLQPQHCYYKAARTNLVMINLRSHVSEAGTITEAM